MSDTISASMVKELRERTGSGMMECKKALVEANGDMDLAIENMRKSGLAKADKKIRTNCRRGHYRRKNKRRRQNCGYGRS